MRYFLYGLLALAAVAGFWLFEGDFPAAEVDAKYSNAASRFFELADGSRIHYRDQGKADGPAIVLIHGSNASLHTWEPWVAELGSRYRLITVDLPGHGLTGITLADDYSSEAYVSTVRQLTRHLNVWPFVLGGNSMGGGVTWRYTLAHNEDVQAMILVDASGLPEWREQVSDKDRDDVPLGFRLLRQPWFQFVARYLDPRYLVEQGLRTSHYDPDFVDQALVDRYYDLTMREGSRHATLKRFSQRRDTTVEHNLSQLAQPTLVLWGKYDSLIPVEVGERFVDALPNAQLMVYDEVGHIPMEEVPARSAADVDQFMQSISARHLIREPQPSSAETSMTPADQPSERAQ